jgi:hypothetical protein
MERCQPDELDEIPLLVIHPERVRSKRVADLAPSDATVSPPKQTAAAAISPLNSCRSPNARDSVVIARDEERSPMNVDEMRSNRAENKLPETKKKTEKRLAQNGTIPNGENAVAADRVTGRGMEVKSPPVHSSPRASVPVPSDPQTEKRPSQETDHGGKAKRSKKATATPKTVAEAEGNSVLPSRYVVAVEGRVGGKVEPNEKRQQSSGNSSPPLYKRPAEDQVADQNTAVTAAANVKQEPVGAGGDQEGDRGGPEWSPPAVRLPTYTHMIKQALSG